MNTQPVKKTGEDNAPRKTEQHAQLTCERCGQKTDAGIWIGFVYVGAECLTEADNEYIE